MTLAIVRYESGHVQCSFNLPHTEAFNADGTFIQCNVTTYLQEHIGDIIVIVAGKGDPGPTVCYILHVMS